MNIRLQKILQTLPIAVLLVQIGTLRADDVTSAPKVKPGSPAVPDLEKDAEFRMAFPSPYARLLGLETALKKRGVSVDWVPMYDKFASKKIETMGDDRAQRAFAIGVRLADGIIALMGKDEEKLLQCAKDVRTCALKLGIDRKDVKTGDSVVRAVEDANWGQVFFELGMMQQEIVSRLEKSNGTEQDRSQTALVASGAWLQGVRYATEVILQHRETEDLSNMLRAAPLALRLKSELLKAPVDVAVLPTTKRSIEILDQVIPLIDISREAIIPVEQLKKIHALATSAIATALP